jgi:MFS family permease
VDLTVQQELSAPMIPGRLGDRLPPGWIGILAVAVMVCGSAMTGMMLTIVLPMLPEMAREVVGGNNVLIAMPTVGIVVGGIVAGPLIDRMSPRTIMLWMVLAFGIVGLGGMVLGGWPLLISRFLMGVISTCISASSTTLIGEHIYLPKRSRVLGIQMGGGSLAGIIAMNASGAIDDSFGWRASFLLFPLIAAIVFIPGYFLIPRFVRSLSTEGSAAGGARPRGLFDAFHGIGRVLAGMWPLYLFLLALHMTAYTNNSQASFVLAMDGVTSAAERAQMLSLGHAMIVTAALCYPFTRRILGSRWIPAFFLTMMASGLTLLGLSHSLVLAAVALGLLGIGNGTLFPHQSSLVLARAAPEFRGRAVGLMVSTQFLADSINPFFFPPMAAVIGLRYAIVTIGLIAAVGVLAALAYGSRSTNMPLPATAKGFGH